MLDLLACMMDPGLFGVTFYGLWFTGTIRSIHTYSPSFVVVVVALFGLLLFYDHYHHFELCLMVSASLSRIP